MFAKRLKELRSKKGILQKDVAKYLGITTSAYGYYEQSKRAPDPETLEKLADFFKVSVDYLLGRTDDPSPPSKDEPKDLEDILKQSDVHFQGVPLSEEEKASVISFIKHAFKLATQMKKKTD